jgi:hypothetical protein
MSRLERLAFTLLVLLLGITVGALGFWLVTPEPWSPLGPYPQQAVVSDRSIDVDEGAGTTITVPLVRSTGDVTVQGVKCNDEAVTVAGTVSWVSVDPPGTQVVVGSGVRTRSPGCSSFTFHNPIPQEIIDRTAALEDLGFTPVWRITGTETPQRENGETGESLSWTTEPFVVEVTR